MKSLIFKILLTLFCIFVFAATYSLNKFDLGLSSFRYLNPIAPVAAVMVVLFLLLAVTNEMDENLKISFLGTLFLFFVIVGFIAFPHYKERASLRDHIYYEQPDGIQVTYSDSSETNSVSLSERDVHSILGNLQNIYSNEAPTTSLGQPAN